MDNDNAIEDEIDQLLADEAAARMEIQDGEDRNQPPPLAQLQQQQQRPPPPPPPPPRFPQPQQQQAPHQPPPPPPPPPLQVQEQQQLLLPQQLQQQLPAPLPRPVQQQSEEQHPALPQALRAPERRQPFRQQQQRAIQQQPFAQGQPQFQGQRAGRAGGPQLEVAPWNNRNGRQHPYRGSRGGREARVKNDLKMLAYFMVECVRGIRVGHEEGGGHQLYLHGQQQQPPPYPAQPQPPFPIAPPGVQEYADENLPPQDEPNVEQ